MGRLIRSSEFDGENNLIQRIEQLYDKANRLEKQSWVIDGDSYSESYTYNDPAVGADASVHPKDGSLASVTTATGDTVSFTYDNLRRLQKETVTNARGAVLLRTAYDFATISGNQSSMQVRFRNVRLGTSDSVLEGNQYTYDGVGNITVISQSTGNYYPLVKYSYDELGQMIKEVYYDGEGDADSNITATYDYTYDTAGNILTKSKNGTVTKTYSYEDTAWRDLLTAVNGTAISYENGNPLNYYNGEKSYTNLTWENGRQLASITVDGSTYNYSYDGDGIRTQKVVNGVTHTYVTQNGKVMRETIGTGATAKVLDFIYDNSGKPFALRYSTNGGSSYATYYYVLNLQGDVAKLVRIYAGATIQEYEEMASYTYNAWGEIVASSGSMADINPLRYRGYYYDTETGFYYLQSRYYDPANHRFINADGYASTGTGFMGYNMFAYCNNNPITFRDSRGTQPAGTLTAGDSDLSGTEAVQLGGGGLGAALVVAITVALDPRTVLITLTIAELFELQGKTKSEEKVKVEEKVDTLNKPRPKLTVIYRYYASKTENLWPREKRDYDGLSFSTKPPRPGVSAVVTTIEQVNATGILVASSTGGSHVTVIPVNGTVIEWMRQGESSIWSQMLSLIVTEWKGS